MNHIKDCWAKVHECKNIKEVREVLDNMPMWSGLWWVNLENGEYVVTNDFYDKDLDDSVEESVSLDIPAPDLVLEKADLDSYDEITGNIEVSKSIFDDFEQDAAINIMFAEEEQDAIIHTYQMRYDTADTIGMELIPE